MIRFLLFLLLPACCFGQQIHAHNDYEKQRPFTDAYEQRADYIEADVYLVNGKLVVAHTRSEIDTSRTLERLYITPILRLFEQHKGRVSSDRKYSFNLVIDIKDKAEDVMPILVGIIHQNMDVFNRQVNPNAVQMIISGNRPKVNEYVDYPHFILFDGRPGEVYDDETLRHVALISDNFSNYSRWNGTGDLPDDDRNKLKRIIKRAHDQGKPIRFWAIPDNANAWKQLRKLGVDVINTDKVAEATAFLR
ncbi:hypothetical protein GCM10023187_09020 [Nibrella viscosa]|uniref:Glycerophosphoryl diester phosphodiesterase n=1 Tax=Nibrella viscosa TaxID=1084524 RepID=A0ABP8JZH7_9BACT